MSRRPVLVLFFVVAALVFGAIALTTESPKPAAAQGCSIDRNTISINPIDENGGYTQGQVIYISASGSCGTMRVRIDERVIAEIGSTSITAEWKTVEFSTGNHVIYIEGRGEGGWENADRWDRTVYVSGGQGALPTVPGQPNYCYTTAVNVTPASGPIGTTFTFSGSGQCQGNFQAVKFELDGESYGEATVQVHSATWDSSHSWIGTHSLCFRITNQSWMDGVRSCTSFSVTAANVPPVQAPAVGIPATLPPTQPPVSGGQPGTGSQSARMPFDAQSYCVWLGYQGVRYTGDAYSGQCHSGGQSGRNFDVDSVCQHSYGAQYPYAGLGSIADPNSWYCAATPQGRPASNPVSNPPTGSGNNNPSNGNNATARPPTSGSSSNTNTGTCTGAPGPSRLSAGMTASVADEDPLPLTMYTSTSQSSAVVASIPIREVVSIIGNRQCVGSYTWIEVGWNGRTGYVIELWPAGGYNLVPAGSNTTTTTTTTTNTNTTNPSHVNPAEQSLVIDPNGNQVAVGDRPEWSAACNDKWPSRLAVGMTIAATNGNGYYIRIRSGAGTNYSDIAHANEHDPATIIGGPTCNEYVWWQIRLPNGTTGWTAEAGPALYFWYPTGWDVAMVPVTEEQLPPQNEIPEPVISPISTGFSVNPSFIVIYGAPEVPNAVCLDSVPTASAGNRWFTKEYAEYVVADLNYLETQTLADLGFFSFLSSIPVDMAEDEMVDMLEEIGRNAGIRGAVLLGNFVDAGLGYTFGSSIDRRIYLVDLRSWKVLFVSKLNRARTTSNCVELPETLALERPSPGFDFYWTAFGDFLNLGAWIECASSTEACQSLFRLYIEK